MSRQLHPDLSYEKATQASGQVGEVKFGFGPYIPNWCISNVLKHFPACA